MLVSTLRGVLLLAVIAACTACATEDLHGANWADEGPSRAVMPHAARMAEVTGWAYLICNSENGKASACGLLKETPVGWGYGDAALSARSRFALREAADGAMFDGNGSTLLPVMFCMEGKAAECDEARSEARRFGQDIATVLKAFRAGDCPSALSQVGTLNAPGAEEMIKWNCKRRSEEAAVEKAGGGRPK